MNTANAELLELAQVVFEQHFGMPFRFFDLEYLEPVHADNAGWFLSEPQDWLSPEARNSAQQGQVTVQPISDLFQALVIPLKMRDQCEIVAIEIFAVRPLHEADGLNEVLPWLADSLPPHEIAYCQPDLLRRLGEGALASIVGRRQLRNREAELGQMASQLTRNYEEITLLHQLTREAQVSHGVRALQEQTLSLLLEMLPARQIVYIDAKDEAVLSQGDPVLLPIRCRELVRELGARAARSVLVDNHLSTRGLASDFGSVERVVSVPVSEGKDQFGWLLAMRTADSPELGSVEASLMTAVAAILATHQTNVRLFASVKELFLGVVRALSSAIDAKDAYTCGHSERVARVARLLARKLGLPEDEQNRIYLSGLLHDVGKIGIRDSVLGKPGRLTDEEIAHIQQHPKIGFDILTGVRQLKPVLCGVRSHHESMDGTGYPDRLKGEEIPLMARIIAVADSYDAMSSDRPYRKGMAREQVEQIFRDGAGRQWDAQVVETLFAMHDELWQKHTLFNQTPGAEGPTASVQGPTDSCDQPLDIGKISKFISLSIG